MVLLWDDTVVSDSQILDGHNGNAAAIFTRENLLNHVLGAMPRGLGQEEWLQALPRALVAGFVKTDKEFQSRGMEFGELTCYFFFVLSNICYALKLMHYLLRLIIFRGNIWNHCYLCNS